MQNNGYAYADIYVSILGYMAEIIQQIEAKYDRKLEYLNLDSFPEQAQLPEGDFIFMTDWSIQVDGDKYGDEHQLMLGFSVTNDPNLMRLETEYMNELIMEISKRLPRRATINIMENLNPTNQVGVLIFSDSYSVMATRIDGSRAFKTVLVTLLSPQRLKTNSSQP